MERTNVVLSFSVYISIYEWWAITEQLVLNSTILETSDQYDNAHRVNDPLTTTRNVENAIIIKGMFPWYYIYMVMSSLLVCYRINNNVIILYI